MSSELCTQAPYRQRHYACIHPETYKYFFPREQVAELWGRLEARYGAIRQLSGFGAMEIRSPKLLLRATVGGNPVTVIRTRACRPADIDELHRIMGFEPAP